VFVYPWSLKFCERHPFRPHSSMDRVRASEAWDAGSIPAGGTLKKIDLFLFDLDGTLIDSKRDIADSVHHTLRVLGLHQVDDETIYSFVGNGVTPLIQKSVASAIGGGLDFDKALAIFKKHYDEHCLVTTKPFPGVMEILKLFEKTTKVVITNKS